MKRLKTRIAAWAVAAGMIFSLTTIAAAADYTDMPTGWSREAMEAAVDNGLLKGSSGLLNPTGNLTRAEMAAVVVRAFGSCDAADMTEFTDVSRDAWYFTEAAQAVQMGVLTGEGTILAPERDITRQEAFTVLARALRLENGSVSDLAQFTDASSVSNWAVGPVSAMVKAGYVNGNNGRLNPTSPISREEFAQLMHNIFALYITENGEVTQIPKGNILVSVPDVTLKGAEVTGDLIIGDGVGEGDVTLDHVKITGRLVVRGGGVNSIHIINSGVEKVIISKVNGDVRVVTDTDSSVSVVTVDGGKNDVIIEGTVHTIEITSGDTPVILRNATVDAVEVSAPSASVSLAGNTSVSTLSVTAKDVTIDTERTATVATVKADVDVTVTGEGNVKKAEGSGAVTDEKGNDVVTSPVPVTPDDPATGGTVEHKLTYYIKDGEMDKHYISCSVPNCTRAGHSGSEAHDTAGRNGTCSKCGYKDITTHDKHEVDADTPWEKSADGHWQTCKWVGCFVRLNEGSHDTNGTGGACSVCGYKEGNTCPNGNHTSYSWTKQDESGHEGVCTACGASISGAHTYNGSGTVCTVCYWDKSTSKPAECPPGQHTVDDWVYTKDGMHKGQCSVCGNEITAGCETDETEAAQAPSCTTPGKGATYTCRWCHQVSGGEEIPATGHSWGDAVLNTDDGKYYHTCSKCSAVEKTDAPNNE